MVIFVEKFPKIIGQLFHAVTGSLRLMRIAICANFMTPFTKDGSTDAVPKILNGPNLILGVFGSYML